MKDPEVDALIDKATTATDLAATQQAWTDVDKKVMDGADVFPRCGPRACSTGRRRSDERLLQPGFGMYDYVSLGVKK